MSLPAMCYTLLYTAIIRLDGSNRTRTMFLFRSGQGKVKEPIVWVPHIRQLILLCTRMKNERRYGHLEQHNHCSPMASGPQLPDTGLFQYPANMDSRGDLLAIRYLNPGVGGKITGSSNKRRHCFRGQNTGSYICTPLLRHHKTKLFSWN